MEDSLYVPLSDGRYQPTRLTQGPWSPDRQHGGPVAALLAYALESAAPDGWLVPQLTVDFMRAVPLAELAVRTEIVRDGRRARCVSASLAYQEQVCARARAWQVAPGRSPQGGEDAGAGSNPPRLPQESSYGRARFRFGFQQAVELRFVRGSFRAHGPAAAWARLVVPLLPGRPASPLQRTAALADFGSGISALVDVDTWGYHNLDLSLHLHRSPTGEWICLDAASVIGPEGTGVCHSTLHDAAGAFGAAAQSLFLTPR
jgi:Acyl-CoA thioesterase C-terminal domain/Acyl-CoA thioesterase N-terminal domain